MQNSFYIMGKRLRGWDGGVRLATCEFWSSSRVCFKPFKLSIEANSSSLIKSDAYNLKQISTFYLKTGPHELRSFFVCSVTAKNIYILSALHINVDKPNKVLLQG